MAQCEALNCNSSVSQRVRARGAVLWLCDVHRTGLNDALHLTPHLPPRATKKRNRFDDQRRADQRARGNP